MTGPTLPPKDASERVEQILTLTETLTEHLMQETEAFSNHRPQDAAATLEQTQKLANMYRHESARIKANPGLIAEADPALRDRLKSATLAFQDALERHAVAVDASKVVTEGLVRAMAGEVATTRPTASGYGPTARATDADGRAVTLNKKA
ncbi:MAG: flagellar basal body protein [Asticcacaulis sp.]